MIHPPNVFKLISHIKTPPANTFSNVKTIWRTDKKFLTKSALKIRNIRIEILIPNREWIF